MARRCLLDDLNPPEHAERTHLSEHQIGRWLRGVSEPRLPDFLALVEAISGRCSDLVAALVPIAEVPSLCASRMRVRRLVFEEPWTAAILTQLGVLQPHPDPVPLVAASLGLEAALVEWILALLLEAGAVSQTRDGIVVSAPLTVDARPTSDDLSAVRRHWAYVSGQRLCSPEPDDRFIYNVFNVSHADLVRIRELQVAAYREIREIVAASQPPQVAALLVTHLFAWPLPDDVVPR